MISMAIAHAKLNLPIDNFIVGETQTIRSNFTHQNITDGRIFFHPFPSSHAEQQQQQQQQPTTTEGNQTTTKLVTSKLLKRSFPGRVHKK
jgi:hypothetical protein